MDTSQKPIIIEFPLRGEWHVPTTPAKRVPSHGTNRMGLTYAFDFWQINWESHLKPFYQVSLLRRILFGVPLNKCYCWGQNIYAPCDAKIVKVVDAIPERKNVHWLVESVIGIGKSASFDERKDKFSKIAGNYIIMQSAEHVYLAFVHLQKDSITVSIDDKVKKGDLLGKVGHSGNSTSPHLHFQLMDSSDIANANGIPCLFEQYELYQNGRWRTVYHQIPSDQDRIRFNK